MNETPWPSLVLDHLPMTDKIHIVDNLLVDLDAQGDAEPIPASHVAELRHRVAESKSRPDEGSSWEEVKADIEKEP